MGRKPNPKRRQELLAAVAAYLELHGLAGLSLRPLAAAVGVSPRTLLYHFESKERLLAEALNAAPSLDEARREFAESSRALFDRLRRLWKRTAEPSARPYLTLFFEVYAAALREPERYSTFLGTVVEQWLDLLVPLLQAEGLAAPAARATATELLALHHGCALDLLASGDHMRVTSAYLSRLAELELDSWDASRPSASVSSASSRSSANGISTRVGVTFGRKPVRRWNARDARSASAGSTDFERVRYVRAPIARAARSVARTDSPSLTTRFASRRLSAWPGAASTARACPSVNSPRASIQRMSSGSSSSRSRFETLDADRATRSAIPPTARPNSSISTAYARASSTADSCSRATFSTSDRSSDSLSSASRTSAGTLARPASPAARQRRSPAISSYPPAGRDLTTTGWSRPCASIERARPEPASGSNRRRGWRGFGWIASTGSCTSSGPSPMPPTRTSNPRPRPRRFSGTLDKLHRHLPVGLGSSRVPVVDDRRQAEARCLGQTHRSRNDRVEHELSEVPPHLCGNFRRQPGSAVHHRQQHA